MIMGVVDIGPNVLAPLGTLCTHATPRVLTFVEFIVASMVARVLL
jgi:hypothetical protein